MIHHNDAGGGFRSIYGQVINHCHAHSANPRQDCGRASPRAEHWAATSSTAMAITGDIILSPTALVADGKTFPLAVAADVADFQTDRGRQAARILRFTKPVDPRLRNGNTLCGAPVRWIAVYRSDGGKSLNLSAFSSVQQPDGEVGEGLCGTFLYSR